ncbi:DHH phosphoesterase [Leucogyrophana mollusca]|uniref:DHH phosphoesterase n=1 Tax=Leucogyrophana mollusca TaxID=85980 RepID=A0ACB8B8J1_9AGAM|nr:DHH phosphoesterase [Leucogyrophana mollusca]
MSNPSALSQYLSSQKARYLEDVKRGKGRDWTVVMGNEAGDLDTIASSIAYAWFRSEVDRRPSIAFIQTQRSDFHLRPENVHALSLAGVQQDLEELLCLEDIQEGPSFPSNSFALVDHNALSIRYSSYNDNATVVAVIDHHEDEGKYLETADPRIVAPSGSCASHIAQLRPPHFPAELATLLLSAIVVDTQGLKEGGKALQVDQEAAAFLLPLSTLAPSSFLSVQDDTESLSDIPEIQELSDELGEMKMSVSHLDTRDLLRRDYKEYTYTLSWTSPASAIRAGMSTVPVGFGKWIVEDQDSFFSSTEAWMNERELAVLGILTSFRDEDKLTKNDRPKHKREVMLVIREGAKIVQDDGSIGDAAASVDAQELASRVWSGFEADEVLRLKRVDFGRYGIGSGGDNGSRENGLFGSSVRARVYKQRNVTATRKQSAPVLRDILEGGSPPT